MQYATCPECHLPQEVVDDGSGRRSQVFRRHGTVDLDLCPGSEQTPPAPARDPGGWRVQILSREHGILQSPLRIGPYDEAQADADERWLRTGRCRDRYWPEIDPAAKRWIEYLSPEDVLLDLEIVVGGCGMDMGFHLVYNLGCTLWPHGTDKPHGRRNGEPDSDGGYALKHRWL